MGQLRGVTSYKSFTASHAHPFPAGLAVGDLLVDTVADRNPLATPSGWSALTALDSYNEFSVLWWKIADAADISAGALMYSGNPQYNLAVMAAFIGGTFDRANPIAAAVVDSTNAPNIITSAVVAKSYSPVMSFAGVVFSGGQTGFVIGRNGVQLVKEQLNDSGVSMCADTPANETALNQVWQSSVGAYSGHYITYTTTSAVGTAAMPAMTSRSALLVAAFDTAAIRPVANERLYNSAASLVVLADGTPSPFSVQFQVNLRSDFSGVMIQTVQLDAQVKGVVQTSLTSALPPNVPIYWRTRAGDGTSWGPWSAPRVFTFALEDTTATEEITANVGVTLIGSQQALEQVIENIGVLVIGSRDLFEEITENAGVPIVINRLGGEYAYEGDVSTNVPKPHLWFIYKTSGFAGDHVYLYGQGLGALQSQYHGLVFVDYGPDFTTVDAGAAVFDWSEQPAGIHGYDEQRLIYPGNSAAPPRVNVEVQIVEAIMPVAIAPVNNIAAVPNQIYATTDGGVSDRRTFLTYPALPVKMGFPRTANTTTARLSQRPRFESFQVIPAEHLSLAVDPFVIVNGRPERAPLFGSFSHTVARTGNPQRTTNLEAASAVATGGFRRFLVDPTKIVARPDLGTGVSLWSPSAGPNDQGLLMHVDTAGYVDAGYTLPSRNGPIARPAFILPGGAYLTTQNPVGDAVGFTAILIAVVHAPATARSVLLATSPVGNPTGTSRYELELSSDLLTTKIGGILSSYRLTALSGRAVIIGISVSPTTALTTISALNRQSFGSGHPPIAPTETTRLHIGRPDDLTPIDETARIDILEVLVFPGLQSNEDMTRWVNVFDSIYGGASA